MIRRYVKRQTDSYNQHYFGWLSPIMLERMLKDE
jgi:hypothetical protein